MTQERARRRLHREANLPQPMRMRGQLGKWLMRHAMRRYFPQDILHRPKNDFCDADLGLVPGALAGEADRIARGAALANTGWFRADEVSRVASEHRTGGRIMVGCCGSC